MFKGQCWRCFKMQVGGCQCIMSSAPFTYLSVQCIWHILNNATPLNTLNNSVAQVRRANTNVVKKISATCKASAKYFRRELPRSTSANTSAKHFRQLSCIRLMRYISYSTVTDAAQLKCHAYLSETINPTESHIWMPQAHAHIMNDAPRTITRQKNTCHNAMVHHNTY